METGRPAGRIGLGDLSLDLDGGTLTRDGQIVELRAKSFALLCHLARNPGRVLSKTDLLDAVWPDVAVTEDSLTQAVRDIRVALGPAAGALRTVARRGYLLDLGPDEPAPSAPARRQRIGVRPFASAGLEARDGAMPTLIRDEILGGLARFRSLDVLRGAEACDQMVDGLVWSDSAGAMLRLTLIDPESDRVAWSATFPCGGGPAPDAETVRWIVGALHAAIETEAELRSYRRKTESLSAWEQFSRGVIACGETRPDALDRAAEALEAAVKADPEFGLAWSFRAYVELARHDFLMAPPGVIAMVRDMVERGARLAPDEARAMSQLGYVQLMMREYAGAEARIGLACRLNPFSLDIMMDKALLCLCRGRPAETLTWLDRAEAMQPLKDAPNLHSVRGDALYHLGRYGEAMESFLRMADIPVRRQLWLAATAAMMGDRAEARRRIGLFRAGMPGADPVEIARRTYPYEHQADSEDLLEGIRQAVAAG